MKKALTSGKNSIIESGSRTERETIFGAEGPSVRVREKLSQKRNKIERTHPVDLQKKEKTRKNCLFFSNQREETS